MKPHAFIAMPFGTKPAPDGTLIDFDRVYAEYIKPALEGAGLVAFRADDEQRAGDILTDMFQELLMADLVVADLTLDNPNVWYELGVRHALRARGVILVQGPRPNQPFDNYTERKLRYTFDAWTRDPRTLAADIAKLTRMVCETMATSTRRKVSPVFQLIPSLQQPEWRQLMLSERNEFSEAHDNWALRMEIARQKNRPGDILVLADEAPVRAFRVEGKRCAGNALLKLRHFDFALEQFEAALDIDPDDKQSREKKAVCLGRLGRYEEARTWVAQLTAEYATDPEVWALAGRVAKDNWVQRWCTDSSSVQEMQDAARLEAAALDEAVDPYYKAFVTDPSHHYSGINALTLQLLRRHLGGDSNKAVIENLTGGVLWAILTAQERDRKDYWARASYAELCLLLNPLGSVRREYAAAVAAANSDWFALDSTLQTLTLFTNLGFRPTETAAALQIVSREIDRAAKPYQPRLVFLFSGHTIDAPDRPSPRFPAGKEGAAARKIGEALDALGAAPGDLALTQGASGGDILFLEACQQRGLRVQLLLPFDEPMFIERSILPATNGEAWRDRFYAIKTRLTDPTRVMPVDLGVMPRSAADEINPFQRCNLWLLNTALAYGVDKVRFVCLWDGGAGDGPGGTGHMFEEVKRRTGRVTRIDSRSL